MSTRDDNLTPAQRAERDARLVEAPRMSDTELAEFTGRVRAWDERNPDVTAGWTPARRGY